MNNSVLSYQTWLQQAVQQLSVKQSIAEAKVDAQALLQFVTQKSSAQLMAFAETPLSLQQQQRLTEYMTRRLQGEPIAYIVGERGFWTLDLAVSDKTLIPRPDTECLVETALSLIANQFDSNETLRILDLGTGTGAIALALAYELQQQQKNYQIIGVDRIAESVTLAKQNAIRNQLTQVEFLESDWFSALSTQQFQIIVSNPPYIAADDPHLQQGDVRFEPRSALVAENNGLADIEHIIDQGRRFIRKQGWLLLEHGWQQEEAVQTLFKRYNWQQIQTINDYGGNPRVTFAKWSG
ncbi:peptide chain release factor N(5)-glutamine methyltransferase [Gallibacterium sp. AGMB14963]|uniref:peptide chain release factor N(5)-glutamine methyltransferase n=1 Tax=Gallibacterium faecale TaxID=3019086 RepID=UPI0022F19057|nr:peptide chain release factor N(5)-glutamine methyltransferase [Gallibacterium sp. AGMB14963]MDA3978448.1 peptide chain release factor N(5)-glutamine methyltransferase [Gallibacterium sp. AGMB14963]